MKPWGYKITVVAYVPGPASLEDIEHAAEAVNVVLPWATFVGAGVVVVDDEPDDEVAA